MKAKYISRNLKLLIVLYWVVLILLKAGELIFQQPVKALTIEIETILIKTFVSMLLFPPSVCPFSPSTWPSVNAGVALHGAWGHPQVLFILEPAL